MIYYIHILAFPEVGARTRDGTALPKDLMQPLKKGKAEPRETFHSIPFHYIPLHYITLATPISCACISARTCSYVTVQPIILLPGPIPKPNMTILQPCS